MQIAQQQKPITRPKSAHSAFTPSKLSTYNRGGEKQKKLKEKYDHIWEQEEQKRTFRAREMTSREPEVGIYLPQSFISFVKLLIDLPKARPEVYGPERTQLVNRTETGRSQGV